MLTVIVSQNFPNLHVKQIQKQGNDEHASFFLAFRNMVKLASISKSITVKIFWLPNFTFTVACNINFDLPS